MHKIVNLRWSTICGGVLMVALSACAGTSMTWPTTEPRLPAMSSSAPDPYIPKVQDCISIKQATPSQYVCHGKVYTAQQLQKIRENPTSVAESSH